jgi:hypothetical protein
VIGVDYWRAQLRMFDEAEAQLKEFNEQEVKLGSLRVEPARRESGAGSFADKSIGRRAERLQRMRYAIVVKPNRHPFNRRVVRKVDGASFINRDLAADPTRVPLDEVYIWRVAVRALSVGFDVLAALIASVAINHPRRIYIGAHARIEQRNRRHAQFAEKLSTVHAPQDTPASAARPNRPGRPRRHQEAFKTAPVRVRLRQASGRLYWQLGR